MPQGVFDLLALEVVDMTAEELAFILGVVLPAEFSYEVAGHNQSTNSGCWAKVSLIQGPSRGQVPDWVYGERSEVDAVGY